jgi:SAM-dependent methyltransferase
MTDNSIAVTMAHADTNQNSSQASFGAPQLLHLGCGLFAPAEWINVDGSLNAWFAQHPGLRRLCGALHLAPRSQTEIPWPRNVRIANLRKRLPFETGSMDAVYASHVLEHLFRNDALALLRECYRMLKPGGLCRMLVPDLTTIIGEYLGQQTLPGEVGAKGDPARKLCRRLAMRAESRPRGSLIYRLYTALTDFHEHKWMYDGPSLVNILAEAGFTACKERAYLESDIPFLEKVETEGRVLHGAGVVAEGRKP